MRLKQRLAVLAAVAVLVTALVAVVVRWSGRGSTVITASGTVESTEADLGFQVPGRIDSIAVREGDAVSVGVPLAWLDQRELVARRRAAAAQQQSARARLAELERGYRSEEIAQGRAALRAAERRLEDARRDLQRTLRLFEGGAVSQQQLDNQQTALELATSEHEGAVERLQLLERGPRAEQIAAQRGVLAQAEAAVAQLDAALEHTVIRAPFTGVVTVRHRQPGETVPAGAPVLTVMDPDDRWVRIYVREDQVGRAALGLPATITADAYRDRTYQGEVVFIANEAEFTPRNVQTAQERVKLVYRVKVRITHDPSFDLKPGLPADVRLETGTP